LTIKRVSVFVVALVVAIKVLFRARRHGAFAKKTLLEDFSDQRHFLKNFSNRRLFSKTVRIEAFSWI
jgi:hypothetical protein